MLKKTNKTEQNNNNETKKSLQNYSKSQNDFKVIHIGKRDENIEYAFRETCFGIYKKGNKYLFVEKDGELNMVGGGLEAGESFEQCLKREFEEESGYVVTSVQSFVVVDTYWQAGHGTFPMHSKANIFIVDCSDDVGNPTENGHTVKFCTLTQALSQLQLPYQKQAIKSFIEYKKTGKI